MSQEAARVKEEPDTVADEVFIKQEELEPDCVEVPYVAIEAAIVEVEFDPPVPPVEELHSKDSREPAVYMSRQDELLKPVCVDMPARLGADSVSQYAGVKDELTRQLDCIQRPNTALTGLFKDELLPNLTDCWVRIERCEAAEKVIQKQMAELYAKVNYDFLCEKCKQKENYEFCEACNINIRALNQLRKLHGKREKVQFTCRICFKKFLQKKHLQQHKVLYHRNYKILQMKKPTECYNAYLPRVYSEKTICRSTSNVLNTTNVNTEKLVPIKHSVTGAIQVMSSEIATDLINPEHVVPTLNRGRVRKPYNCKECNKPAFKEKLCDECLKKRVLGNMYVKKPTVENNFLGPKTVLRIKRPQHLCNEKHQLSLGKQQKLGETGTRECSVQLERCEVAEQALQIKIDAVKSEIIEKMWPRPNVTSRKSAERCCDICGTKTAGARFCEACEKVQAQNFLRKLKSGFNCSACKRKTRGGANFCRVCERKQAEELLIKLNLG